MEKRDISLHFDFDLTTKEITDKHGNVYTLDLEEVKKDMKSALERILEHRKSDHIEKAKKQDKDYDYKKAVSQLDLNQLGKFSKKNLSNFVYYFVHHFSYFSNTEDEFNKASDKFDLVEHFVKAEDREKEDKKKISDLKSRIESLHDTQWDARRSLMDQIRMLENSDSESVENSIKNFLYKSVLVYAMGPGAQTNRGRDAYHNRGMNRHNMPRFRYDTACYVNKDNLNKFIKFVLECNLLKLDDTIEEIFKEVTLMNNQENSNGAYLHYPKIGAVLFLLCVQHNDAESFEYLVSKGLNSSHMVLDAKKYQQYQINRGYTEKVRKFHFFQFYAKYFFRKDFWTAKFIQDKEIKLEPKEYVYSSEERKEMEKLQAEHKEGETISYSLERLLKKQKDLDEVYEHRVKELPRLIKKYEIELGWFKRFLDLCGKDIQLYDYHYKQEEIYSIKKLKKDFELIIKDSNVGYGPYVFLNASHPYEKMDEMYRFKEEKVRNKIESESKALKKQYVEYMAPVIENIVYDYLKDNHTIELTESMKRAHALIENLKKLKKGSGENVNMDFRFTENSEQVIEFKARKKKGSSGYYSQSNQSLEGNSLATMTLNIVNFPDWENVLGNAQKLYFKSPKELPEDEVYLCLGSYRFVIPFSKITDDKLLLKVCKTYLEDKIDTLSDLDLTINSDKKKIQDKIKNKIKEIEKLKSMLNE